jgi:hypothetical protein
MQQLAIQPGQSLEFTTFRATTMDRQSQSHSPQKEPTNDDKDTTCLAPQEHGFNYRNKRTNDLKTPTQTKKESPSRKKDPILIHSQLPIRQTPNKKRMQPVTSNCSKTTLPICTIATHGI